MKPYKIELLPNQHKRLETNKKTTRYRWFKFLVPLVGLEPTLPNGKQILSLSRLPVPPQRHSAFLVDMTLIY